MFDLRNLLRYFSGTLPVHWTHQTVTPFATRAAMLNLHYEIDLRRSRPLLLCQVMCLGNCSGRPWLCQTEYWMMQGLDCHGEDLKAWVHIRRTGYPVSEDSRLLACLAMYFGPRPPLFRVFSWLRLTP